MRLKSWLVVSVMVPALVCRALIAPGFMPRTSDHFSVALKICPGHASPAAPAGAGHPGPHPVPQLDHPCVFSFGGASAPPLAEFWSATLALDARLPITFFNSPNVDSFLGRAQSARGPPLAA
jgi:hypothetical protein